MTDRWWRVEVTDVAGQIVSIEPQSMSGRENLQEIDEAAIREAAYQLLAFIGELPQAAGKDAI
jgi:hypothetical protein